MTCALVTGVWPFHDPVVANAGGPLTPSLDRATGGVAAVARAAAPPLAGSVPSPAAGEHGNLATRGAAALGVARRA